MLAKAALQILAISCSLLLLPLPLLCCALQAEACTYNSFRGQIWLQQHAAKRQHRLLDQLCLSMWGSKLPHDGPALELYDHTHIVPKHACSQQQAMAMRLHVRSAIGKTMGLRSLDHSLSWLRRPDAKTRGNQLEYQHHIVAAAACISQQQQDMSGPAPCLAVTMSYASLNQSQQNCTMNSCSQKYLGVS